MGDQAWGGARPGAPWGRGLESKGAGRAEGGLLGPQAPTSRVTVWLCPHTTCDFAGPESSPVVENSRKLNTGYRCGIYLVAKPALTQQEATHSLCVSHWRWGVHHPERV